MASEDQVSRCLQSRRWCRDAVHVSLKNNAGLGQSMQTVEDWLSQLGLGKYVEAFVQNDVDLRALPHITEADLQELGVSLGHRKIILAAINGLGRPRLDDLPPGSHPRREVGAFALKSRQEPAADRRLLSVFFCDLVGSTALSARLDPEDMHELTRRYQNSVAGAVTRFGGYVAQYLGDGVLAYFGWPVAYEDHAERSIRSGFEALAAVEDIHSPDDQPLKARIGIASGHVVVGDIQRQRRERARLDRRGHSQSCCAPASRCRAWPDRGCRQHAAARRAVFRNRESRRAGVERLQFTHCRVRGSRRT